MTVELPECEHREKGKCMIVDKTTTITYPTGTVVMYKSAPSCREVLEAEECKEEWA